MDGVECVQSNINQNKNYLHAYHITAQISDMEDVESNEHELA